VLCRVLGVYMSLVAGKLARGVRTDVLTSNKARKYLGPYLHSSGGYI
jgi:hypothetical protein